MLVLTLTIGARAAAMSSPVEPRIDPEVRELLRAGRARVLVELRIAPETERPEERRSRIEATQDAVLARLGGLHAAVQRRYQTLPYLALEIDAATLAALEGMGDLVVRVMPDLPLRPNR